MNESHNGLDTIAESGKKTHDEIAAIQTDTQKSQLVIISIVVQRVNLILIPFSVDWVLAGQWQFRGDLSSPFTRQSLIIAMEHFW